MPGQNLTHIPRRLTATIGGVFGPSFIVELTDDRLTHTESSHRDTNPQSTTVTPTAQQWQRFRQTLDSINVWQWHNHYPNPGITDGTHWSLTVEYQNREIDTGGDNNYPKADGQPSKTPDPTTTFKRLLKAIQQLLGSLTFE